MRISDWSSDVCSSDLGPHHSAQKSTSTGVCRDFCSTSASKVAVVASKTCGRAGESGDIRGIRGVFRPRLCQLAGIPTECKKYLTLRSEEHTSELQSLMRNSYAVF